MQLKLGIGVLVMQKIMIYVKIFKMYFENVYIEYLIYVLNILFNLKIVSIVLYLIS